MKNNEEHPLVPSYLDPDMLSRVLNLGIQKSYEKGHLFTDTRSQKPLLFLKRGTVRNFYRMEDLEMTVFISSEGDFISTSDFFNNFLTPTYLEALEPLEVVEVNKEKLMHAYLADPSLEQFGRLFAEYQFTLLARNYQMLCMKSANDRYNYFLKWYPHLAGRISLKYIAALLKMDQATLSRVRGKKNPAKAYSGSS
jgi:hypothetical protein